jgi:hypothetical protein
MMTGRRLNRTTLGIGLGGLICLGSALFLLPRAVANVSTEDALAAVGPCPAGAAWNADCLQNLTGTVASVTHHPAGRTIDYDLQAWTSDGYLDAEFSGSNGLVGQARGGDELILTVWRGDVVAVSGYGLRESATAVDSQRTRSELAGTSFLLGMATFLLLATVMSVVRSGDRFVLLRGVPKFAVLTCVMVGVVLLVNTMLLVDGIGPRVDLGVVVGCLPAVLVLCAMLAWSKPRGGVR